MDPLKFLIIWMLPGLVFTVIGVQEYRRGRWQVSRFEFSIWMSVVLLLGPFMLLALAADNK